MYIQLTLEQHRGFEVLSPVHRNPHLTFDSPKSIRSLTDNSLTTHILVGVFIIYCILTTKQAKENVKEIVRKRHL